MVVYDDLFKKDFTKVTDKELLEFRQERIDNLFNGQAGSQANMESKALVDVIDKEFERRFKKRAEIISVIALIISVISLLISISIKWLPIP